MPNVSKIVEARETIQILMELSRLLCTGLDPDTLTLCVRLCEAGVDPVALAVVVRELRQEVVVYKAKKEAENAENKNP